MIMRLDICLSTATGYALVPSNKDTMLRANATVIHRGRIETVKLGSNPTRRPIRAVEYNENTHDMMTDVKISAACLLTSCKIA
jgi:hypothetical protein